MQKNNIRYKFYFLRKIFRNNCSIFIKKFNIGFNDNILNQDSFEFKVCTKGLIENDKNTKYINK